MDDVRETEGRLVIREPPAILACCEHTSAVENIGPFWKATGFRYWSKPATWHH